MIQEIVELHKHEGNTGKWNLQHQDFFFGRVMHVVIKIQKLRGGDIWVWCGRAGAVTCSDCYSFFSLKA